jgi:hypothetical protein
VETSANGSSIQAMARISKAGMMKFERGLEESLSMDIQIPQDGSEDEAIRSVKEQLKSLGTTSSDAEVRKRVRDARSA